jgi:hypothetical protein
MTHTDTCIINVEKKEKKENFKTDVVIESTMKIGHTFSLVRDTLQD